MIDDGVDNAPDLIFVPDKVIELFDEITASDAMDNDASALVYIGGYVAFSVGKKIKCSDCISRLSLSTNLQSEISPDISEYLKLIDHGGLKWPTLFTVDLCICTFLLFQLILEKVEDELLPHSNQRAFLMSCVAAYHGSELDFEEMCSAYKLSLGQLVKMCFRIMCNWQHLIEQLL